MRLLSIAFLLTLFLAGLASVAARDAPRDDGAGDVPKDFDTIPSLERPFPLDRRRERKSDCVGVTCSGHGRCWEGMGTCWCDDEYKASGHECIAIHRCVGVTCSGHGRCEKPDGKCVCDFGYIARAQSCVLEGSAEGTTTGWAGLLGLLGVSGLLLGTGLLGYGVLQRRKNARISLRADVYSNSLGEIGPSLYSDNDFQYPSQRNSRETLYDDNEELFGSDLDDHAALIDLNPKRTLLKAPSPPRMPSPARPTAERPNVHLTVPGSPIRPKFDPRNYLSADAVTVYKNLKLGRGGYGQVYQGKLWDHTDVAVKTFEDVDVKDPHVMNAFYAEVAAWEMLYDENVLPLRAYCDNPPMIITPLMSNGNLRQYLSTKNWDRTEGIRLLTETAKGLRFLHGISVVHGDLKALNVLVDEKYKAKLADFGLSRLRSGHSRSIGPGRGGGTEGFQAPEVLRRQAAKEPADVYSFAMLCYEVLSGGAAPFHDRRAGKTVEELVLDSQRPGCPKGVPDRLYRLMCGCWVQNPKHRLTMIKVVEELEEISRLLANGAFSSC